MAHLSCVYQCKSQARNDPFLIQQINVFAQIVRNIPSSVKADLGNYRGGILKAALSQAQFQQYRGASKQSQDCDFEIEIHSIFNDITLLSTGLDLISVSPHTTHEEIISFNRQRSIVERRLLSLEILSTSDIIQDAIFIATRIATIICANYLFRELSPSLSVMAFLKSKLLQTLLDIEPNLEPHHMTTANTEILLWTCFVGGMISNEKTYFANGIGRMMQCLGLQSWREVETCLDRHLWPKRMRDRNCTALWHEVQIHLDLTF